MGFLLGFMFGILKFLSFSLIQKITGLVKSMAFKSPIHCRTLHSFIEVHLMTVKIRSVHAGKFCLAADSKSASAAHSRTVDHYGIHAHSCGYAVLFSKHTYEFHHGERSDGDNVIVILTVFNELTGLKQHTGNWSGKTVALAHGSFKENGNIFDVYDLPGTYSVISDSPEEKIARDYICFEDNDLTVIVADATCIERNLNLALQIMEMSNKVLLCINLADEAKRSGVAIDTALLEKELGIPVVLICAKKRRDIKELKLKIASLCRENREYEPYLVKYPLEIETAASVIGESLCSLNISRKAQRFIALKLLDNFELGSSLVGALSPDDKQKTYILTTLQDMKTILEEKNIFPVNIRDMIVESIIASAVSIGRKCTSTTSSSLHSKTVKIDKILTSKLLGIPITLLFFAIILWITIVGANYPSQLLSKAFALLKPRLESI